MNQQKLPRIFAFDMDGTLLRDNHKLSERNRRALEQIAAEGDYLVVASGRPYDSLPEDVMAVEGITHAITSNGVGVYECSGARRICHRTMVPQAAASIIETLHSLHATYEFLVEGKAYTWKYFWENPKMYGMNDTGAYYIRTTRTPVENLEAYALEHLTEVDAINVFVRDEEEKGFLIEEMKKLPDVYVTHAVPFMLELVNGGAGKGAALRWLAEYLQIPRERVYAFGNEANDMDMIEYAGVGVAMDNSPDYVKAIADVIAPDNEADGVAVFLEEL